MSTPLTELTPTPTHDHARGCLVCGLVVSLGWLALLMGTYLFVTGFLPGMERELLALSGGWTFLGVTLLLVGGVRAYNVFLRGPY